MNAIVGGKLILKDRILEGYALLYGDKIQGIIPREHVPAEAEVLDAADGYVSPGLIDLHTHAYAGQDVCDGTQVCIRTIAGGLVAGGVTGFLPTTMTLGLDVVCRALEVCRTLQEESKTWAGSTILGVHAEGPFINPAKKGGQDGRYILPPDAAFVKEHADIIRIVTLAPEMDTGDFAAIREIVRDTDVVVSMGHTATDYATAMAAVAAGVSHTTHLFNAMTPLAHRAPGVVGAALNADVSCELIADTYHVDPALYDMLWKLKGRRLCIISDCLVGGLPTGNYVLGGAKIAYDGTVGRMEDGTISGSGLRLNQGVWNLYTHSAIPLWECVNAASLNPATTLGLEKTKGSLEVGKDADILITDSQFCVQKTIIRGEIRYETASIG